MFSIKNLALFFFITLIYHQKVLSQSAYVIKINQTTILNKEPKFSRPIYKTLKAGDKVEFLDVVYNNDSEYFKVKDSYSTGYIKSSSVEITDASLKIL